MGKRLVAQALARAPARSAGASPRPPSAYCTVSHVTRQGRLPHCTPPPSQQQPRGFPVWPRPTVFRAVAPGSGARPSIAGPIGPGSANRPSCPFARVSSRCSYNTTSLHTHSVAARPRAPRRRRTAGRAPCPWAVGVLGRAATRGGHGPRPTSRALVPPAAPARTTPGRAEGRGRRGALGPSTCRAGPRRTIVDRIVVRVAGAAQPALGRRQTRRHARR